MFSKKTDWNGHKNRNHWNVNLWLHNDERLYGLLCNYVRRHRSKDDAAEALRVLLSDLGKTHTPDGAPYSKTTIRAAMRGMK